MLAIARCRQGTGTRRCLGGRILAKVRCVCHVPGTKFAMFLNRRLNRMKILYWDTDGIAIWMTRLEQGYFQRPLRCADRTHVIITHAEPQGILSGGDLASVRKQLRAAMAIEPKLFQFRFEWLPVFLIG